MGVKPVVTIESPLNGAVVPRPYTARGQVTPQDGYVGPGVVRLYNDVTGELIATATAPTVGGPWQVEVTGAIAGLRSGTVTPQQIARALRSALALPQKTSTTRRSSVAAPSSGATVLTARRSGIVTPSTPAGGGGFAFVGAGTVARSATLWGPGTITPALPSGVQEGDILLIHTNAENVPAGWTNVGSAVFHKRAGSSEAAPTVSCNGDEENGGNYTAVVYAFRPPSASGTYIDVTSGASVGTITSGTGTATGTALTTTTANAMCLMFVRLDQSGITFATPGATVDTIGHQTQAAGYNSMALAYDDAPSNAAGAQAAPTINYSPFGGGGQTGIVTTIWLRGS